MALDTVARKDFAARAGMSQRYIECHVVYARKIPRAQSMERLWSACEASGAHFDRAALLAFFYPETSHT